MNLSETIPEFKTGSFEEWLTPDIKEHILDNHKGVKETLDLAESTFNAGKASGYWTSVKDKEPAGWCNIMLCHTGESWLNGKMTKTYGAVYFSIGNYEKGKWEVLNYALDKFEVIAFHEIQNDNFRPFLEKMGGIII